MDDLVLRPLNMMRSTLAEPLSLSPYTRKPADVVRFYREAIRRISEPSGGERVALGTVVPWRDPGFFAAQLMVEGYRKANGEEDPRAVSHYGRIAF